MTPAERLRLIANRLDLHASTLGLVRETVFGIPTDERDKENHVYDPATCVRDGLLPVISELLEFTTDLENIANETEKAQQAEVSS